jgi:hypothetical protein
LNAPLKARTEEPHVGSLKLSRSLVLAWSLYGLLASAAALALLSSARGELLPNAVRAVAPLAFGGFLVLFAVYRFALVRAERYPPFRAFFQVGAGLLFILFLLPGAGRKIQGEPRSLAELMADADPQVRALACEVARHRPAGRGVALALTSRLDDPVPAVREEAAKSLAALAGADLGAGADPAQAKHRWSAFARGLPAP